MIHGDKPSLKRAASSVDAVERNSLETPRPTKRLKDEPQHPLLLLDFNPNTCTSESSIRSRFDKIATYLLHECTLAYEESNSSDTDPKLPMEYEILEVEMYLHREGIHEDPFTHADNDDESRICGQWRFHRAPRRSSTTPSTAVQTRSLAGGYRGGTRKGLDLTLGTASVHPATTGATTSRFFGPAFSSATGATNTIVRGGVLFRSIRRLSDARVISGPSLLVDELLRLGSASSIAELVQTRWSNNIYAFPSEASAAREGGASLVLRTRTSSSTKPQIYRSPRIGLDLSHPTTRLEPTDPRIAYISRPYRYFIHPELLVANGRGHTLLGVYHHVTSEAPLSDDEISKVVSIAGLQGKTTIKYLAEYRAAYRSGNLKSFLGSSGKGAASSPVGFLRLMGALHRYTEEHSA